MGNEAHNRQIKPCAHVLSFKLNYDVILWGK